MRTRLRPGTIDRARSLRQRATDPERKLWHVLRGMRAQGFHFRRQVPFRGYMLAFVEHSARIIIELDESHCDADEVKDRVLFSEGYRLLRFRKFDALTNPWRIAQSIVADVGERCASPSP